MNVYKYSQSTNQDTGIIDSMVSTGRLSTFDKEMNLQAKDQLNTLQNKTNKPLDPDKIQDSEMAEETRNLQYLANLVAAREFVQQQSGVAGQEAWSAIMRTLPAAKIDIPSNYYELDAAVQSNPQLKATFDKLLPTALEKVRGNAVINQLINKLRSNKSSKPALPRQYFNLQKFKVAQYSKFPVKGFSDFIDKFLGDIMSYDGTGQEGDALSNQAIKEIQSAVGQGFEVEANSVLKSIRQLELNDRDKAEEMLRVIYTKWLSPNMKANGIDDNIGITTMSEAKPKGIIKFNLSDHVLNNHGEVVKTSSKHFGDEYLLYGPTEKRICPKLRGKSGGQPGSGDVVSEYICRHHCLDGIVIDDNKTICGEALWRANVMDKFSREYVDKDGNITGGYLNNRFEINRNVPEENKMRLKPGETRKPRPASMGNMESRLQDMRNKEAADRKYRPDTDTSKPFNWTKDVDQNNVEIDQTERNRREKDSGHKIVEYTNRDKGENNPKVASFNLKRAAGRTHKWIDHNSPTPDQIEFRRKEFNPVLLTDPGNTSGRWAGGWLDGQWKCNKCGTVIRNEEETNQHALIKEHKLECYHLASFNLSTYKTASFEENKSSDNDEFAKAMASGESFNIDESEAFPDRYTIEELKAWALEPEEQNPQFLPAYKLWSKWSQGISAEPQLVQESIRELEGLMTDPEISLNEDDKESLSNLIAKLVPYTESNNTTSSGMDQNSQSIGQSLPPIAASTKEAKSPYGEDKEDNKKGSFNLCKYKEAYEKKSK